MTKVFCKGGFALATVIVSALISVLSSAYAQDKKQLNSNEVIKEYGKIATGIALEERCLLLSAEATREYYWQQYMLDTALNQVFTNAPVLNMVRGSALQASRNERFKCDQESLDFINKSLQRARDLNYTLTGQTFEINVSDHLFDQERLTIISSAAGTNALCKQLLPKYDEQLRVGLKALTQFYQVRYEGIADKSSIDNAYQETASQHKEVCGDITRQHSLQGWQLTRLLMKQFRLAFADK